MLKLDTLGKYLPAYTTALKNAQFTLHYIDAFAGTGACHVKIRGERLMVPGSASIAMACKPPFHKMVFIEKSPRKVKALERLKEVAPERTIAIIRDDANNALPSYLDSLNQKQDRVIAFLDPYGMQVEWETLRRIAASKIADVWYLFPLSAVYRQASLDAADIDEDKSASLTRILGTDEWRDAFYREQKGLFWNSEVRTANIPEMLAWVKQRLETIFPGVAKPKLLHQQRDSGRSGPPLFALFFAVSNPAPKAKALALRIAEGVLKN